MSFRQFRNEEYSDGETFKMLIIEVERLLCLPHDGDQTDKSLWDVLWKAVEGVPWLFQTKKKDRNEFIFARALTDFQITFTNILHIERKRIAVIKSCSETRKLTTIAHTTPMMNVTTNMT